MTRPAPLARLRLLTGAAFLAALTAACAPSQGAREAGPGTSILREGQAGAETILPGTPPAARFEGGGGPLKEIRMNPEQPELYLGVWEGDYAPINMRYMEVQGEPVGHAVLTILDVDGRVARGILRLEEPGKDYKPSTWTGAFTLTGHIMVLGAHAIMFQQDRMRFIEADMMLPDGKFYRMRLSQNE